LEIINLTYHKGELDSKKAVLIEMIKNLELSKIQLYMELTDLQWRIGEERLPHERQPKCKVQIYHHLSEAVIQLSFDGMLPMYDSDRKYKNAIRDYYIQSTIQALDWDKVNIRFQHGFIYIAHFYRDLKVRDYDNRNRKSLLDAIRTTGIIKDDDWRSITILEKGFKDDAKDHLEIFVGEYGYIHEVIQLIDQYSVRTER
jgi:hypothetical protein